MTNDQLHGEVARMARELADKESQLNRLGPLMLRAHAEIKQLRAERDEARREVCRMKSLNFDQRISPEAYAALNKWDCFPEAKP